MAIDLSATYDDDESDTGSPPLAPPRAVVRIFGLLSLDRMFLLILCAASVGFFAVAYMISLDDPEYFSRQAIAALPVSSVDPMMTGATEGEAPTAMPAPRIVRAKPLVPADFEIVMVFEGEAILATAEELWRVKVGSLVPGLGEILAIDESESGGTVKASSAVLTTVAQ